MDIHISTRKELSFRNMLISVIVCVSVTLLGASSILYFNFQNIILRQVYHSEINNLTRASREFTDTTQVVTALSTQIYNDFIISKLLFYAEPDVYDQAAAMEQLRSYLRTLPFIESIYIYNGNSNNFYVSSNLIRNGKQVQSELDDQDILQVIQRFQEYKPFQPIPRTYSVGNDQITTSSYTYLDYNMLTDKTKLNSAVIVNVAKEWLNKSLRYGDEDIGGASFIIDQNGNLLSGKDRVSMANQSYVRQIINNPNQSGYLLTTVDGVESLITYLQADQLGWRYIHSTPYQPIIKNIQTMRKHTVQISLLILLLGTIGSIIISRRLYRPFSSMLVKLRKLEREKSDSLQILKQEAFREIILRSKTELSSVLHKKLADYKSAINPLGKLVVILLRIDSYSTFSREYSSDDQRLLKFAIQNICMEILNPSYTVEPIDLWEDSLLLILNVEDLKEHAANRNNILPFLEEIKTNVAKYLIISISATISSEKSGLEQIPHLYRQTVEASMHRLFYGHGSIIFAEDIMELKSKKYSYPSSKEKQLVEFLVAAKMDEAKQTYDKIIGETAEYPYSVIHLVISQLTLTLGNVLATIQKNNSLTIDTEFDSGILLLQQEETIEEVNDYFYRLFEEIGEKLREKRGTRHVDLIACVNQIIEENYANPDLNINIIAEQMDISPTYLSRIYKQFSLHGISGYVAEVRMKKAKELLLTTDYSIAQIAELAGFSSSSYFFRMFKRFTSVTPTDFRTSRNSKHGK